jgi:lysophospholipase L1-like esterase
MRLFHKILLTLSIQLLIIIGLLEIGLRILEPYNHNLRVLLYHPHFLNQYEQINSLEALLNTRPGGFKPYAKRVGFVLNSRSFRTKEYTDEKPANYYRILAIGDSFTAASGRVPYSQHWPVLLEQSLKSTVSEKIELIKLGVGGVGPRFELRLWQLEGTKLHADLVILAFCIGNDFTDEQGSVAPRSLSQWLTEISYVFRIMRNLYRLTGVENPTEIVESTRTVDNQRGGYETKDYLYDPNQPTFTRPAFLEVVSSRMSITHQTNRAMFEILFAHIKPVLLWFRDSVIQQPAKFLVMLIPDEYQVYPALLEEAASRLGHHPDDYQVDLPQTRLSQFFQANQIAYLDLLPIFLQHNEKVLYRLQDTHWNIEGNQLAAKVLAEYLEHNGLIEYNKLTE